MSTESQVRDLKRFFLFHTDFFRQTANVSSQVGVFSLDIEIKHSRLTILNHTSSHFCSILV